jgi:hypothetical protein
MNFWEHHLPWALLKILQTLPKIKRQQPRGGGSDPFAGRGCALPFQRMRAAFSAPASAGAVLQCPLPAGGAAMVAVEGPGEIPRHA